MFLFRDLSTSATAAVVLCASALLAACGGGEQDETFQPARIVAFGDENSKIEPNGRQYNVNNLTPTAVNPQGVACRNNAIWVQWVAADYGLSFGECSGTAARPNALMKAEVGHTVAQVRAAVNATPLNASDLVTLMVGVHDIIQVYDANPNASAAQLAALAQARGQDLGALVQQIIGSGARVLFTTIPDVGTAPITTPAAGASPPYDAGKLSAMSKAFNDGLNAGSSTPNGGGRNGAVMQVDTLINVYRNNTGAYVDFQDRVNAACLTTGGAIIANASLAQDCTTLDITATGPVFDLWAGRLQFGTYTQAMLGQEAIARIRANPL